MPALWEGFELSDGDLQYWAEEISAAAQEVSEDEQSAFLHRACEGNDRLLERTREILEAAWELAPAPAVAGRCRPGDTIRDCLILRLVGRGASGEVYKAIQRSLRRLVAIKVVVGGPDALRGFVFEAASTAQLLHPNIAAVYDADLHSATPCIVMEYVDAISLRAWLERYGKSHGEPPPSMFTKSVVSQIAAALHEAHRRGLSHRDIKPENILLRRHGSDYLIKVVDFGIARRVNAPQALTAGTPGYIAPELLTGASSDGRADIFSLGVILYELLTGRHPFSARSAAETHFNTLRVEPDFPSDPARSRLAAVARRALEKSPDDRYRSIEALIADLEGVEADQHDVGVNPLLSEFPSSVQRWVKRHSSGFLLAWLSFAWGCVSLLLSVVSRAACVRVHWTVSNNEVYDMIYGYAIEPNAGLWYLVGASFCALAGAAFLDAAHHGLVRAPLVSVAADGSHTGEDPLARLAAHNRHRFRFITPSLALAALCFVAVPEGLFRSNHAFGWVQADLAARSVGSTYDELRRAGRIGDLSPAIAVCKGCVLTVADATNRSGSFSQPPRVAFTVFLVVALAHQVVLAAFLMWLGSKIIFFFGFLSTALLGNASHGVRLTPDFLDRDDYRFGLGQLDSAYYAILGLVAVGSIGLFLQAAANVSKGTYLLAGDPTPTLFGQAVLLVATLMLLAILLITPACVFLVLTIKTINAELARLSDLRKHLDRQLSAARSTAEREQLRIDLEMVRLQRETAKKQSLIPIRQPAFLGLLSASCLMLIVLPFAINWLGAASPSASRRRTIAETVCAVCGNAARSR